MGNSNSSGQKTPKKYELKPAAGNPSKWYDCEDWTFPSEHNSSRKRINEGSYRPKHIHKGKFYYTVGKDFRCGKCGKKMPDFIRAIWITQVIMS